MTQDAIGDAAKQGICGVRLTMAAHEDEIRSALSRRGVARIRFEPNTEQRRENFDVQTIG